MTTVSQKFVAVLVIDSSPLKPMKCNKESQKVNKAVGADEYSVEVGKVGRWCYQQRQTGQKHGARH